jgi:uncharacterized protein
MPNLRPTTMLEIRVKQLFIHPIKGLSPLSQQSVYLKIGHGIPGDRAFALMYQNKETENHSSNQVPWMKKHHFAMQNDWHILAGLDCTYDAATGMLTIKRKGIELLQADTNSLSGRDRISTFFTGYLAASYPSQGAKQRHIKPLKLVGDYNTTRYPDREIADISLVSQATIDNLCEVSGKFINVCRFRPNIVVEGIPAWSEFDWIGRQIQIGDATIEITARINRCLNINVNPETGEDDINLLSLLQKYFQHTQTGILGKIITNADIAVQELVKVL